jgi:hypothetical protein
MNMNSNVTKIQPRSHGGHFPVDLTDYDGLEYMYECSTRYPWKPIFISLHTMSFWRIPFRTVYGAEKG